MFTLSINALPSNIPSCIDADVSELIIGGQVRVLGPRPARRRDDRRRPRDRGRSSASRRGSRWRRKRPPPKARPPRARPPRARPRARRRRRIPGPKRARPCAAPSPGRSAGAPRPTCSSSGWAIPGAEYAGSLHNAGSDAVELLARRHGASLRAEKGVPARVATATIGGRRVALAVPTTYMNDSGVAVRALARRFGDRRPGRHRRRARRAGPAAGGGAPQGRGRAGGTQRAALHHVAPALAGLPPRAHRDRASPRARTRARRTCCAARRGRCARRSRSRWRRRRTPSSASRRTASTPPCCGATRCRAERR